MDKRKTERIDALVRLVPSGKVASYGQIAGYIPGVTPRMVGYAMAGSGARSDLPWHRILNAKGSISGHAGAAEQRRLLEEEGVRFNNRERLDWALYGWSGPDHISLLELGLDPEDAFRG